MSRLYGHKHREFQDLFDSRQMADRVEALAVVTEISEDAAAFIEQRDMFFYPLSIIKVDRPSHTKAVKPVPLFAWSMRIPGFPEL